MDEASRSAADFLDGLFEANCRVHSIRKHYSRPGCEIYPVTNLTHPFWCRGGLEFGLGVVAPDGRHYEFTVYLDWLRSGWTIQTYAQLYEEESDGDFRYTTLRELPVRKSDNMATCLEHLNAAITDLLSFDDLIPRAGNPPASTPDGPSESN